MPGSQETDFEYQCARLNQWQITPYQIFDLQEDNYTEKDLNKAARKFAYIRNDTPKPSNHHVVLATDEFSGIVALRPITTSNSVTASLS